MKKDRPSRGSGTTGSHWAPITTISLFAVRRRERRVKNEREAKKGEEEGREVVSVITRRVISLL